MNDRKLTVLAALAGVLAVGEFGSAACSPPWRREPAATS
jgi:hypothetical protein